MCEYCRWCHPRPEDFGVEILKLISMKDVAVIFVLFLRGVVVMVLHRACIVFQKSLRDPAHGAVSDKGDSDCHRTSEDETQFLSSSYRL